jgi:hypothetical protein
VFFAGVAVLHIATPSVVTVGTFNTIFPVSLNVSTVPGNIYDFMVNSPSDALAADAEMTFTAVPYLWSQLSNNFSLPGVNGS